MPSPGGAYCEKHMPNTPTHSKHTNIDLVVLVSPEKLLALKANGVITRPMLQIPVRNGLDTSVIHDALNSVLKDQRPRRILLSVLDSAPYETLTDPVAQTLDTYSHIHDTPLIWLPDVTALARAAKLPPARRDILATGRPTPAQRIVRRLRRIARPRAVPSPSEERPDSANPHPLWKPST